MIFWMHSPGVLHDPQGVVLPAVHARRLARASITLQVQKRKALLFSRKFACCTRKVIQRVMAEAPAYS
jgi:hypothetical protein